MIKTIHDEVELVIWLKQMGLYKSGMELPQVDAIKRYRRDDCYDSTPNPFEKLVFNAQIANHRTKQVRIVISKGTSSYRFQLAIAEIGLHDGHILRDIKPKRASKKIFKDYLITEDRFVDYCTSLFEEYKLSLYKPKIVLITEEDLICL